MAGWRGYILESHSLATVSPSPGLLPSGSDSRCHDPFGNQSFAKVQVQCVALGNVLQNECGSRFAFFQPLRPASWTTRLGFFFPVLTVCSQTVAGTTKTHNFFCVLRHSIYMRCNFSAHVYPNRCDQRTRASNVWLRSSRVCFYMLGRANIDQKLKNNIVNLTMMKINHHA